MSGTHGTEDGVSALTKIETEITADDGRRITIDLMDHGFYREDCDMVGIKCGTNKSKQRPPLSFQEPFSEEDWEKLHKADITKPAKKLDNPPPNSFSNDELMKKCDIRVANMTYYYKNGEKLIRDINEERLINYVTIDFKHFEKPFF